MISFRFFLAIITLILITACTTQKAMKETKRQFDNGEYGWAVYTGTIGVTMAAIYDVFTLGGTSDVSSGTNTLSSVTSSISPNSNAAKMLSPMASSSTLLSTENDTSETRQISDVSNNTETRNDIDLSTFNAVEYMERSGNCAKNLSYLSGRLHQSSAPEIKSIRDTILKSDMQPIMLAINKEGISPDEAILQNLQQAEEYNRVVKDAIHTAAQTDGDGGFAPIFPDTCYHLTHYWPAAVDIPVASDIPVHYADAIRYNARTPLQGSLLPLTRLV